MPLFNWIPPTFAKSKFPAGIILPFLGSGTPSNWADFTSANGKQIVGAGSTYAAGDNASAGGDTINGTLDSSGAHSGGTGFTSIDGANTGVGTQYLWDGEGNSAHTHTFSDSVSDAHELTRSYKLIKSSVDVDTLPVNAAVFGASSLVSPYENTHSTVDRFIEANTADGVLTPQSASSVGHTSSTDGDHVHYGSAQSYGSGATSLSIVTSTDAAGDHNHDGTLAGALNTKYFYLSLWHNATAGLSHQQNMIAMWEGSTAPEGWELCDGDNDRPDLRDYYIKIGSEAQQGSFGGDNICTWEKDTQSASPNHTHSGHLEDIGNSGFKTAFHSDPQGSHSNHTVTASSVVLPPYYALSFIIKK